jgi:hypothetical protein
LFAVMSVALTGWAGSGSAADTAATGAGLPLSPDKACSPLADKGIPAAGGYRATMEGVHLRGSFQKVIPVSNGDFDTLQFFAQGTKEAVTQLELDLRLKSMGEVQTRILMRDAAAAPRMARPLGMELLAPSIASPPAEIGGRSQVIGPPTTAGAHMPRTYR